MKILIHAVACALTAALAACSGGPAETPAQPGFEVGASIPTRQTFHARVAAFGELAADQRGAEALSLPQPAEILSIEALPGRRVRRGAALLRYAGDPLTHSAYLQAQSALRLAQDDLVRTERLRGERLATGAQLDAARKAVSDARATLAAQARLGGGEATAVLAAPGDGVVTAVTAQRGQRVAAGATLVQFTPDAGLAAQLAVDPVAAAGIRAGMPVAIQPVYAAERAAPLAGKVTMVANAINPQTHQIDVVASLDATSPLPAGSAITASIDTTAFTAWSVPRGAVQNDAHGDFVYQIERGRAKRVDVKVLSPEGSPVGVAGALDPAAPVITTGSHEIAAGDAVRAPGAPGVSAR